MARRAVSARSAPRDAAASPAAHCCWIAARAARSEIAPRRASARSPVRLATWRASHFAMAIAPSEAPATKSGRRRRGNCLEHASPSRGAAASAAMRAGPWSRRGGATRARRARRRPVLRPASRPRRDWPARRAQGSPCPQSRRSRSDGGGWRGGATRPARRRARPWGRASYRACRLASPARRRVQAAPRSTRGANSRRAARGPLVLGRSFRPPTGLHANRRGGAARSRCPGASPDQKRCRCAVLTERARARRVIARSACPPPGGSVSVDRFGDDARRSRAGDVRRGRRRAPSCSHWRVWTAQRAGQRPTFRAIATASSKVGKEPWK